MDVDILVVGDEEMATNGQVCAGRFFILTPYLCSLSFATVFRLNCYPIKIVLYFPWDNCVDNVDNKPRFNPRLSMLLD